MVPESCDDVFNAQYCVKRVGRFEGKLKMLDNAFVNIKIKIHLLTNLTNQVSNNKIVEKTRF